MDKYWLVTWVTYGSWLPGDPRGFRTFRGREYVPPPARYALAGERVYDATQYAARYRIAQAATDGAVKLTGEERALAHGAMMAEIDGLPIRPRILGTGTWHVHLIARFGSSRIRPSVGRLKSSATRAIPNPGSRKRLWAKGCHMGSLDTERSLEEGIEYVRRHADEGALIHEWPT